MRRSRRLSSLFCRFFNCGVPQAALEGGEQRGQVIEEFGPRQRIAVGQIWIALNRALPLEQQGLTAPMEVLRQGEEFPMDVLQLFRLPEWRAGQSLLRPLRSGPVDGAILKLLQAVYQPPEATFRAVGSVDLLRNGTVALHYD